MLSDWDTGRGDALEISPGGEIFFWVWDNGHRNHNHRYWDLGHEGVVEALINGVLLAGLQTRNILNNGTSTFQGSYAGTVNFVGNKTRELQVGSAAADTTVDQALAENRVIMLTAQKDFPRGTPVGFSPSGRWLLVREGERCTATVGGETAVFAGLAARFLGPRISLVDVEQPEGMAA